MPYLIILFVEQRMLGVPGVNRYPDEIIAGASVGVGVRVGIPLVLGLARGVLLHALGRAGRCYAANAGTLVALVYALDIS